MNRLIACDYPRQAGRAGKSIAVVSRTGSHTLKALAALSGLAEGRYLGAAELARRVKAPANYLGKVLRQLSRAGIVQGRKGGNGGFRLSRSASSIFLFDVLDPIEGLHRDEPVPARQAAVHGNLPRAPGLGARTGHLPRLPEDDHPRRSRRRPAIHCPPQGRTE